MYADLVGEASFWLELREIDRQLQRRTIAAGCLLCGGPLHVADYPRKPRGIPVDAEEAFSTRFSTCCGHCRRRCTPPSVRFLGRRVYAAAIVVLATMRVLVCEAAPRTLVRWSGWWTEQLPTMELWRQLCGRLVPAVQVERLPASLLERYEGRPGAQSRRGLIALLRSLGALTTQTAERAIDDGSARPSQLTQKMPVDRNGRALVARAQAPPSET